MIHILDREAAAHFIYRLHHHGEESSMQPAVSVAKHSLGSLSVARDHCQFQHARRWSAELLSKLPLRGGDIMRSIASVRVDLGSMDAKRCPLDLSLVFDEVRLDLLRALGFMWQQ